jgi:hypothetical protein
MAKTKGSIQPDEFCDDGETRKLNKSRPYGTVYADGYEECKFVQDGIPYRGDGTPVGYIAAEKRGKPVVIPPVEEVLADNERLMRQVNAQQGQIADLLKRLEALEGQRSATASPASPGRETLHVKRQ